MPSFAWVRPSEARVLEPRPLLDLGVGDGQTLRTLARGGLLVGLDHALRTLDAARGAASLVAGEARALPFRDDAFAVVLAADLFHHLSDTELIEVGREIARVGRTLVAWWYERPGRGGPDSPRFPRSYADAADRLTAAGLVVEPLDLELNLTPAPPTVGLRAHRG